MLQRLYKKTVFITGASAGIGAACAKAYAAAGSNVILTARRQEKLQELKSALEASHPKVQVHTAVLDVTSQEQVNQVVATLPASLQKVDILINNAGLVLGLKPLADYPSDEIDTMINTNVKGLVYCTQVFIPRMKEQGGGHIVNVSSISGHEVYANGSIYCATKHAVDAITRSLRYELADSPIRISAISPGLVDTEFSLVRFSGDKERADNVYKGMVPLSGEDIAEVALFMTSRPPHVEIAESIVFPHGQASPTFVHRNSD
ncbi:hypothetical protein IWQ61_007659 [Dispira simplex]|nr:hypothetical protein IWQ61_007659 [Dispira simplex]